MHSVVDYIKKHKEVYLFIFYFIFIALFGLIQKFYIPDVSHLVTWEIDYYLPYSQYFIICYALWWPLVPFAFIFFFFRDIPSFKSLCFQVLVVCYITLIIYLVYPSYLDLRQPIYETDICSKAILWLRSIDPPRNVFPSLHVSETISICFVVYKSKDVLLNKYVKGIIYIVGFLIIISTIYIDQHSIADILFAGILAILFYIICPNFENKKQKVGDA